MKIIFLYCSLIALSLVSCNNKKPNTFILEGEIVGLADSTPIVLSYLTSINEKWVEVIDTTYVIDKKFTFKGDMDELTAAFLNYDNTFTRLYLEPARMKIKLNKNRSWEYVLLGTLIETEYKLLRDKLSSNEQELHNELVITHNIVEQLNSYNSQTSETDSLMKILESNASKRNEIGEKIDQIRLNYILENKNSKIAPHLIYTIAKWGSVDIDTLKNAYDNLSKDIKMTMLGKLAHRQIEQTEQLINGKDIAEGSTAPYFSGIDVSGKKVKLSDIYKQNYVLLDFWASWCKPCLEQVPQLKKIHDSYADKGLIIIGISTDEDKKQWVNAVEKYKLDVWSQILSKADSDSDYFASDISDSYGVEYIPAYFLIDKQGKVLARWKHIEAEQIAFINNMISNP
jgi:peroxiredoxin